MTRVIDWRGALQRSPVGSARALRCRLCPRSTRDRTGIDNGSAVGKTMRRPSLNSLLFFDAAARAGSFVQAAHELHVTHGAVSRQVRQLEIELGVSLFERRNRAVFLTQHGHRLLTSTRRIFDEIECLSRNDDEWILSFRGKDVRGALFAAADALSSEGVSITWAKVHTWGRQIDDVFGIAPPIVDSEMDREGYLESLLRRLRRKVGAKG